VGRRLLAAPASPGGSLTTVAGVAVSGGHYTVIAAGTLGTGPAGRFFDKNSGTWQTVTSALTAGTPQIIEVPPGMVRANLASGVSAAFVSLSRIPED
jgi:hypothetical protein